MSSNSAEHYNNRNFLTLFLAGDVMTGRGIDQILPHSVDPELYERYVQDARQYAQLAEHKYGRVPREVSYKYIWGEALQFLKEQQPDLRIINLETAVTTHDQPAEAKGIHYRMHPKNTGVLTVAGIDACTLANNHVLDWQIGGLRQTISSLQQAGIKTVGAGKNAKKAGQPAVFDLDPKRRLLIFAYGAPDAGVPLSWGAAPNQAGVHLLTEQTDEHANRIIEDINTYKKSGDDVVVSLHWGSNWGYQIHSDHRDFAHRLIDAGAADLIFGHSSHHPKGIELYKRRLILYGCGDLINDYEGISGHEKYRDNIRLMYFPSLYRNGALHKLRMIPVTSIKFRLQKGSQEQTEWIAETLDRQSGKLGSSVNLAKNGTLLLQY